MLFLWYFRVETNWQFVEWKMAMASIIPIISLYPPRKLVPRRVYHTPLKTNISPEKWWLEDVFPIEIVPFFGDMLIFRGVILEIFGQDSSWDPWRSPIRRTWCRSSAAKKNLISDENTCVCVASIWGHVDIYIYQYLPCVNKYIYIYRNICNHNDIKKYVNTMNTIMYGV